MTSKYNWLGSQDDWAKMWRLADFLREQRERLLGGSPYPRLAGWSQLDLALFSAEYEVWKQMWEEYGLSL